jgi:hypothetical protein
MLSFNSRCSGYERRDVTTHCTSFSGNELRIGTEMDYDFIFVAQIITILLYPSNSQLNKVIFGAFEIPVEAETVLDCTEHISSASGLKSVGGTPESKPR